MKLLLSELFGVDMVRRFSAEPGYTPTPVAKPYASLRRCVHSQGRMQGFNVGVAGFHNVLVHEYVSVDMALIYSILCEGLYRRAVLLASKLLEEAPERHGPLALQG